MKNIQIDKLVRSKRKTISLIINGNAELIIKAPHRVSLKEINEIVNSRFEWIIEKKEDAIRRRAEFIKKRFSFGEKFSYLGESYTLIYTDNSKEILCFDGNRFILNLDFIEDAPQHFYNWYFNQANLIFPKRAQMIAEASGLNFRAIKVSTAKRLWGSCSSKKNININWKLIMAPIEIIDYIISHELVHTVELNHSKRFYDLVVKLCPNYKEYDEWLNRNGEKLSL